MALNVEIKRNKNETSASLIKRFTKKIQSSGVLPRVKSLRYSDRKPSAYKKKKARLKSIENKSKFDLLFKMGKISGFGNRVFKK